MKKVFFTALTLILLFACKQKPGSNVKDNSKTDSTKFFQISQYIQSEIKAVNKTPYYIYKIDIINNKRDSTPIKTPDFNQLSTPFYNPDINKPDLKKFYTESIFFDETTKNYTISYATTNKELEVQNIEILLKDDGQTVKRVFIRKFFNYSDSSAIEQLSWKPGESFQINRSVQKPDNKEDSRQTIVVWNENS